MTDITEVDIELIAAYLTLVTALPLLQTHRWLTGQKTNDELVRHRKHNC